MIILIVLKVILVVFVIAIVVVVAIATEDEREAPRGRWADTAEQQPAAAGGQVDLHVGLAGNFVKLSGHAKARLATTTFPIAVALMEVWP